MRRVMNGGRSNAPQSMMHRRPSMPNRSHHVPKIFIPHVPFDLVLAEGSFPRCKPVVDDKPFIDALIKRNQDLTPSAIEQSNLLNLVSKVQTVLDNLILAPGDFDACHLDEVRQVGSFKKGTMLSYKPVADICVILRTLPTREAIVQLATKLIEELRKQNPTEMKHLRTTMNETGFEIACESVAVQLLITTQLQNIKKLDPKLHLDAKVCLRNAASIRHTRWFEENASNLNIKVLVRLLKDLCNRFDGLKPLNAWIIALTAHYAVMNNPKNEPLHLHQAFRRVFQIISAGFFLPGSVGFIDPCEPGSFRVHTALTLEQQDQVCYTFQTLLRVLSHGGYKQILGLEGNSSIATSTSVWTGVVITPSDKAFEQPKESESNKELEEQNSS